MKYYIFESGQRRPLALHLVTWCRENDIYVEMVGEGLLEEEQVRQILRNKRVKAHADRRRRNDLPKNL